jgi:vacuolar protein sorting-associated protein 54
MQLMQLKSITAKHLALASQCLSVQMMLIPGIQEHIKVHLPAKKHVLLNDLDRVVQDYVVHQQEISQKFVTILRDRVQVHCRTLKALDWKDDAMVVPTQAMTSLVKETTTLHKVLSGILPSETVTQIFQNVFNMVNTKVPEYFTNFSMPTHSSKKR